MRHLLIAGLIIANTGCGPSDTAKAPAPIEKVPVVFDGGLTKQASGQIAHGERLTWVLGCRGCHGTGLQGERFYELYASNLTTDLPRYSDAQLERLMRDGLHPTGREVWAMPSELFQHLSGPDMTALIAYLRTIEPAGPPTGQRLPFTPETRADFELIDSLAIPKGPGI